MDLWVFAGGFVADCVGDFVDDCVGNTIGKFNCWCQCWLIHCFCWYTIKLGINVGSVEIQLGFCVDLFVGSFVGV